MVAHVAPLGAAATVRPPFNQKLFDNGNAADATRDDPSACEGHFFEVIAEGELAWEYTNPITRDGATKVLGDVLPMTIACSGTFVTALTIRRSQAAT